MRLIDADVLIEHLLEVMKTANHFGNIERVSEIGACIGVIKGEKTITPKWRPKPLPRATHCLVAIKWAPDDIEVTEADTTFLLKEHSERIVAWMPLPDPPKGGDS